MLESRVIPGETYPGAPSFALRHEWFAVRDDAAVVVQLTTQSDLQSISDVAWAPGDAAIAWIARRWVGGVAGQAGVFVAPVEFDGNGDVTGLAFQPATATVSVSDVMFSFVDWSPDATRLVLSDGIVWIADLSTGAASRLERTVRGNQRESVLGTYPAWSPDGSRIAYSSSSRIWTIAPDGTGATALTAPAYAESDAIPAWSPHGSDLVFLRSGSMSLTSRWDVCRVAASGGTVVNLTADLDTRPVSYGGVGQASPAAWRLRAGGGRGVRLRSLPYDHDRRRSSCAHGTGGSDSRGPVDPCSSPRRT